MIKRLRKNIILVNILLVGTVILLIFAAVCINSYSSAKTELERSMNMIAERSLDDYKRPPEKFGEKKHDNQPSQLNSYITVAVDYEGNISNCLYEGMGKIIYEDNKEMIFKVIFEKGNKKYGIIYDNKRKIYEGEFEDDKFNG